MKKSLILFALAHSFYIQAQDQLLVNSNQSLLNTNPSFAGSNGSLRDQFVYRNQWPSLSGNSVTFYNGIDGYVKKLHGGIALTGMVNDQSHGTYKSSQLNLIYAPIFECKESGLKIIPSLQVSYLQKQVDVSGLIFANNIYSYSIIQPSATKYNFDGSAGLLIHYKNLYVGGTVFHINQPDMGVLVNSKLPSRMSLNASYNLSLNEKTLLNFSAVFTKQDKFNSLQLSANAIFLKHIIAGLGYTSGDNVFVNLGYRANYFSVTFGYDKTYSKLAGSTAGSYQLALGLSLRKKQAGQLPVSFEKW